MEYLNWEDKYSVGNEVVDEQHKKLFSMYNDLVKSIEKHDQKEVIGKLLENLIEYVAFHFSDEERLMKAGNYPELEEHQRVHKDLRNKVYDIFTKYITGEDVNVEEVASFLENWLKNHVLGMDMKYKEYIKGLK